MTEWYTNNMTAFYTVRGGIISCNYDDSNNLLSFEVTCPKCGEQARINLDDAGECFFCGNVYFWHHERLEEDGRKRIGASVYWEDK